MYDRSSTKRKTLLRVLIGNRSAGSAVTAVSDYYTQLSFIEIKYENARDSNQNYLVGIHLDGAMFAPINRLARPAITISCTYSKLN